VTERIWDYLQGFAVILSDIVLYAMMMGMIPVFTGQTHIIALPLWIVCAAVQLLAACVLISTSASWSVYLVFHAAAIAAGTYLIVRASVFPVYAADMRFFLGFGVLLTGGHIALAAYRLPSANTLLRYVDVMIVVTAFYLYCAYGTGNAADQSCLGCAMAALALNLLVTCHLRTGGEGCRVIRGAGVGSRLALLLILAVCIGITGTVVGVASGEIHSIVDFVLVILSAVWRVISAIFSVLGNILAFLLLLLIALFPMTSAPVRENAVEHLETNIEEILPETESFWNSQLMMGLAGICLLAGILWLLWRLKDVRIRRPERMKQKKQIVRRSHLRASLLQLWMRMRDAVIFEWEYLRYRKTPQGVFVLAQRIGLRHKVVRRRDESPGAYIRRLDAEKNLGIRELASWLDEAYYGESGVRKEAFDYRAYVGKLKRWNS
jgi:hypothetical protein